MLIAVVLVVPGLAGRPPLRRAAAAAGRRSGGRRLRQPGTFLLCLRAWLFAWLGGDGHGLWLGAEGRELAAAAAVTGADAITTLRCQQASRPEDQIWHRPRNQTPAA